MNQELKHNINHHQQQSYVNTVHCWNQNHYKVEKCFLEGHLYSIMCTWILINCFLAKNICCNYLNQMYLVKRSQAHLLQLCFKMSEFRHFSLASHLFMTRFLMEIFKGQTYPITSNIWETFQPEFIVKSWPRIYFQQIWSRMLCPLKAANDWNVSRTRHK